MVVERDYVIGKLDEWYNRLFREKYTDKVAEEFQYRVKKKLNPDYIESVSENDNLYFISLDSSRNFSEVFYLYFYCNLKAVENSNTLTSEFILSKKAKGLDKKVLETDHASFIKLVENLRYKSDKKFPDDITDDDLKEAHIKIFGNLKKASGLFRNIIKKYIKDLGDKYENEEIVYEQYVVLKNYLDAVGDESFWLYETFFGG
ncbi:MAG: hypothetical protein AABW83_03780 [Nanoarchaeota archaeon]